MAKQQKRIRKHEVLLLDRQIRREEPCEDRWIDTIQSSKDGIKINAELIEDLDLLSSLSEKQRQVVIGTIILGWTEQEVAAAIGSSQQAVNRLKKRALAQLRQELTQDDAHGR